MEIKKPTRVKVLLKASVTGQLHVHAWHQYTPVRTYYKQCIHEWIEPHWKQRILPKIGRRQNSERKSGVWTVHAVQHWVVWCLDNARMPSRSHHNTDSQDRQQPISCKWVGGRRKRLTVPCWEQRGPSVPLPLVLAISTLEPSPFRYANVSMPRNQRKIGAISYHHGNNQTNVNSYQEWR